jgi:NTE family protein
MRGSFVNKRGPQCQFRRLLCRSAAGALQAINPIAYGAATTCSWQAAHRSCSPGWRQGRRAVGVLKVLEEMHVPIDCIAGTSMGALVGGGYASGIPAKELETFVTTINWKKVVGSQGRRDLEPIEPKRDGVTYSNEFELGLTPNGLVAPGGLINTSNIEDLLRVYVARARLETDFDKLPIPYRAVATDMVSSKMVVLDKGDLATAMRASMAIPGGFAPVVMDDMILSDGGLVRNIPVDIARTPTRSSS